MHIIIVGYVLVSGFYLLLCVLYTYLATVSEYNVQLIITVRGCCYA